MKPPTCWPVPTAGAGSGFVPVVQYQEEHILHTALPHFDSVWIADHFYGFDADKREGFLEGWTTLTIDPDSTTCTGATSVMTKSSGSECRAPSSG